MGFYELYPQVFQVGVSALWVAERFSKGCHVQLANAKCAGPASMNQGVPR